VIREGEGIEVRCPNCGHFMFEISAAGRADVRQVCRYCRKQTKVSIDADGIAFEQPRTVRTAQ
jgi:hypothetical protein